jgi:hypothetical protein
MKTKLNELKLKDKKLFDKFLKINNHELCVYGFTNIYIWRGLFKIYWKIIKNSLCVFFRDKFSFFMYCSPLSEKLNPAVIKESFLIMDNFNKNRDLSRIENIEERESLTYKSFGYECSYKSCDYLCRRRDLVELKGNHFKSKRSCFNYFVKHYGSQYLPYSIADKVACLDLYQRWMDKRKCRYKDTLYQGMLSDSFICLREVLDNFADLNFVGRVIKIDNRIAGFSFGFALSKDIFCILYEITDLSFKGISQFIFRKFCSELKGYQYINIMDDSGLPNLKMAKGSYHPQKLVASFIAKRKNE